MQAESAAASLCGEERRWKALFREPAMWWDNRANAKPVNFPDFKHALTGEKLYVDSPACPDWVAIQLKDLEEPRDVGKRARYRSSSGKTSQAQQQDKDSIIRFYKDVQLQGLKPSVAVAITALKACGKLKQLKTGREIHADVLKNGDLSNLSVANTVISMYAKCGQMEAAQEVFDGMLQRDTVTWNCMIIRYAQNGKGELALQLHARMQREGYVADRVTLLAALKACATLAEKEQARTVEGMLVKVKSLERCKVIHSHACRCFAGQELDLQLASSLVDVYAKCGSMVDAYSVFEQMQDHDVISWNGIVTGYAQYGDGEAALSLFSRMQDRGYKPDGVTYVAALKACALLAEQEESALVEGKLLKAGSLEKGRGIHWQASKDGHEQDSYVANTLVDMYCKCGSLEDALQVFKKIRRRDVVTWNCIIMGCAQSGQSELALEFYARMREDGCAADHITYLAALKACAGLGDSEDAKMVAGQLVKINSLKQGRAIHSDASKTRFISDMFVANSLIDMYTKCGSMVEARQVFDSMQQQDVVSWNCIIRGYAENAENEAALELYSKMQDRGFKPDGYTVIAALKACGNLAEAADDSTKKKLSKQKLLELGRIIHSQAQEWGFESEGFLASALVDMYAKCGSLEDARRAMDENHLVSWNCIINGYAQNGEGATALQHFTFMQDRGLVPDGITFVGALKACSCLAEKEEARMVNGRLLKLESLDEGRRIHYKAAESGLNETNNMFLGSALVDMYAKCGSIAEAWSVFEKMKQRDAVCWNIIILGYAACGEGETALRLHSRMQASGIEPEPNTFVAALKACGCLAALEQGKVLEMEICNAGVDGNPMVATSLVDFYGKCGSMGEAERVFSGIADKDMVVWNALLTGYSRQGDTPTVFRLFHRIIHDEKLRPDDVTFLAVLAACSHAGLVDEGRDYFESMFREHKIAPTREHYACMVDLFGRANRLEEALELIRGMQLEPNRVIWITLLDACRKWKNEQIGRVAFEAILKLDGGHSAAYVLLSDCL